MSEKKKIGNITAPHLKFNYIAALHFYKHVLGEAALNGLDALREAQRQLAQTDLFFLLVFVMNRSDINRKWLFERCREVQLEPNEVLDLWAREHYKSTIITVGMTLLDVINNPEITVGIFSHSKGIADEFLIQIKNELENNPLFHELWPEIFFKEPHKQAQQWSIEKGLVVNRKSNPKESTIESHGLVKGMPTGKHFDLRVYDDVVTMESVSTPAQIQKTTTALQMSVNLGAEGGTFRFIGTRYHLFDTYRTLIDTGEIKSRVRPATHNGKIDGKAVLMSEESLRSKKILQGSYVFSSQMLLNPVADASMGFDKRWLRFDDVDYETAMRSLFRFIIVDPAGGKERKNNDYTTMMVFGYGLDKKYRLLDMRRDRMRLPVRQKTLFELHQQWRPKVVAYEEYGMQADIEHMNEIMVRDVYEFEITPIGGSMRKELRILRLVPYFENDFKSIEDGGSGQPQSRIILPHSCNQLDYENKARDLVKDFVEQEYLAFPVLKHDDMLDCMARIPDLEAMGLIELPNIEPPKTNNKRFGSNHNNNESSESWITA